MRGEILSFDETTGTGLISGDDGARYGFSRSALAQPGQVRSGQRVDFAASGSEASEIMILGGAPGVASGSDAGGGIDWKNLFLSFNGRIRRQHFWIAWLILLVGGWIAGLIPFVGFLISIALIWPNTAIQVKRLHDMGQTGWLALIPWVATIGGLIAAAMMVGVSALMNAQTMSQQDPAGFMAAFGPAMGVLGLVALVNIGFLLWIGLTDGQRGDNRFGPNPKGL